MKKRDNQEKKQFFIMSLFQILPKRRITPAFWKNTSYNDIRTLLSMDIC